MHKQERKDLGGIIVTAETQEEVESFKRIIPWGTISKVGDCHRLVGALEFERFRKEFGNP
jgi:hypothetical protein